MSSAIWIAIEKEGRNKMKKTNQLSLIEEKEKVADDSQQKACRQL
jgi:hypothetical protein